MPRKHYNPKTKKLATCRAKTQESCPLKDEAGNPAPHFANDEEVKAGYERIMAEQNNPHSTLKKSQLTPLDEAMSVLPESHRDLWETSDAFYNTTNVVDPEMLEKIGVFQYINSIHGDDYYKNLYLKQQIRQQIMDNPNGKDWNGYQDDLMDEDFMQQANDAFNNEKPPFTLDEIQPRNKEEENAKEYLQNSLPFVQSLTPEEQNAVSYWSACGSLVANEIEYREDRTDSIFGFQGFDPKDKNYFDNARYLSTMDKALSKAELDEPIDLYRGLKEEIVPKEVVNESYRAKFKNENGDFSPATKEWLNNNFAIGSEVSFKAPQSSASSRDNAEAFSQSSVMFKVKAHRAGANGVVSAWGIMEREYILPRDTNYRVIGTYVDGDEEFPTLMIELEQL